MEQENTQNNEQKKEFDLQKLSKSELKDLASELVNENEELKSEVENAKSLYEKANATALKVSEMSNAYNRMKEEFDNARKRNATVLANSKNDAIESVAKNLFPIMDNFGRAIENIKVEQEKSGVQMIYNQIQNVLSNLGVEKFESMGKEFDHNFHDAILTAEGEENKVIGVIQEGYKLGEKVIRPAQVIVGKKSN